MTTIVIPNDPAYVCFLKDHNIPCSTPTEEKKMSHITVNGYQDVTVRHYWIVDIDSDSITNDDEAEAYAIDKVEQDGYASYQDWEEETDWGTPEIDEIEWEESEYKVNLDINILGKNSNDVRERLEDDVLSCFVIDIKSVEEA